VLLAAFTGRPVVDPVVFPVAKPIQQIASELLVHDRRFVVGPVVLRQGEIGLVVESLAVVLDPNRLDNYFRKAILGRTI
jgi:hypothetical protein